MGQEHFTDLSGTMASNAWLAARDGDAGKGGSSLHVHQEYCNCCILTLAFGKRLCNELVMRTKSLLAMSCIPIGQRNVLWMLLRRRCTNSYREKNRIFFALSMKMGNVSFYGAQCYHAWIPWNLSFLYILFQEGKIPKDAVTPQHQSQFTPKMKANAVPRLLSSLVWIDQYNECYDMTSFMEFV